MNFLGSACSSIHRLFERRTNLQSLGSFLEREVRWMLILIKEILKRILKRKRYLYNNMSQQAMDI